MRLKSSSSRFPRLLNAALVGLLGAAVVFTACSSDDDDEEEFFPRGTTVNESITCVGTNGTCSSSDQCCGAGLCSTSTKKCGVGSCLNGRNGCTSNSQCCSGFCEPAVDHPDVKQCRP